MASLPRHCLDAGSRDPPLWPTAFATVSTPATKIRRSGPPPSPRSRRRRPKSASLAGLPCCGLNAGGQVQPRWPASLAAVSTPAAEISRRGPPPSPRSRRLQLKTAAVARLPCCGLDAGSRDSPRWPAAFATVGLDACSRGPAHRRLRSLYLSEVLKSGTGGVGPLLKVQDCCN